MWQRRYWCQDAPEHTALAACAAQCASWVSSLWQMEQAHGLVAQSCWKCRNDRSPKPPCPQYVLVCFVNVTMWGKKEEKLHVLEELCVARGLTEEGSGEPIAALNADLMAGINYFFYKFEMGMCL